jgi:hypothetical protein
VFALPNFIRDLVNPPRLKQQTPREDGESGRGAKVLLLFACVRYRNALR